MIFHIEIYVKKQTLCMFPPTQVTEKDRKTTEKNLTSSGCISFQPPVDSLPKPLKRMWWRLSPFVIVFFSLAASYLVSGFNLVENYARQIGSFRQVGMKIKQCLNPPPSYPMSLPMTIFNGDTLASPLPPSKPPPGILHHQEYDCKILHDQLWL